MRKEIRWWDFSCLTTNGQYHLLRSFPNTSFCIPVSSDRLNEQLGNSNDAARFLKKKGIVERKVDRYGSPLKPPASLLNLLIRPLRNSHWSATRYRLFRQWWKREKKANFTRRKVIIGIIECEIAGRDNKNTPLISMHVAEVFAAHRYTSVQSNSAIIRAFVHE